MDSNGRRSREVTEGRLLGLADDSLKFIFKDSHQTEPMICVNKQQSTEDKLLETPPTDESPSFRHKKSDETTHRFVAERGGFEPPKPFWGLLAFQAGQFNHSCIFPFVWAKIALF